MKIARLYLRVSTDEQDLNRQTGIEDSTRSAGYYIAESLGCPRRSTRAFAHDR
jgi:DNA invertase Pin-like site-specific DNA recombinase